MRKSVVIFLLFCLIALNSCSIFQPNCTKYITDKHVFRASVEVSSSNLKLAQEKAKSSAERNLLEQVDKIIAEKYSYKDFLSDSDFEAKIDKIRNKILESSEISCSRISQKSGQIIYSTTLEINRSTVEDLIKEFK